MEGMCPMQWLGHGHRCIRGQEEVTASSHSADPARVLAPGPTPDISAPVPALGHCVVAGSRVLPHRSFARMGKVDRCLASWCRYEREEGHTAEGPLQKERLQEEVQAERRLEEALEVEPRGETPLEVVG